MHDRVSRGRCKPARKGTHILAQQCLAQYQAPMPAASRLLLRVQPCAKTCTISVRKEYISLP